MKKNITICIIITQTGYISNLTHSWGLVKGILEENFARRPTLDFYACKMFNDLPEVVKNNSKPVIFADDTSVIVSNPDLVNIKNDLTFSFEQLNAWFSINLLSLNYDKTQYVHFYYG
jgi:hypothetical protein